MLKIIEQLENGCCLLNHTNRMKVEINNTLILKFICLICHNEILLNYEYENT